MLLALATIASAWCAYQAARWRSEEALRFNESNAARIHASEADDLADTALAIDVDSFLEYSKALREGDGEMAQYIENNLFSEHMKGAVESWKASGSAQDGMPSGTPFEMPQYVNPNREDALRLEAEANDKIEQAREAIHNADFYILLTVLFAFVLFFAGVCIKFKAAGVRIAVLSTGAAFFTLAFIIMLTQPVT